MTAQNVGPRFGDAVAEVYDAGRSLPEHVLDELLRRVVSMTALEPGATVLDAGAGTGILAATFLRGGYRYVGIDRSAAMLAESGGGDELVRGELLALPVRDASFDLVVAFRVFGVVPGWRRGIRECLRVLRAGGHLLAGRVWRDPGSLSGFIREERNRLLQDSGIATDRPGADMDAVTRALETQAELTAMLDPLKWSIRTTPRRLMEQNLSGWRITDLSEDERYRLHERLSAAIAAHAGDLDRSVEEPSALTLSLFRKPSRSVT